MWLQDKQVKIDSVQEGIVKEIRDSGREWVVTVHGVYWTALASAGLKFSPGDQVKVIGRKDLKLLIAPI
jgi:membrane protein implicated in regulation of membrane protease activity